MKKSFKWLLCATLVFSSALAVACGEEEVPEVHEHTWATTYSSDANGHWYAATCEHTDQKMSLALHNDANKDGVCDTCNYDTHQGAGHSYATEWSKDENNHWHAANCGHTVAGTDLGAHVDENNDKECDTCGYDYNHTHAYATTWSKDFTNHWHAATCECTIEGIDIAAHVDEDKNGVCDICQGATFDAATHTHTYATEWSKDEKNHWYAAMCDHTGLVQSVTAHNDADKDGDCDVCGWYDEAHTHTYATEWSKNDTKHWHAANCGHTGLIADEADHVMVNGECTTCGYDGNHEHTYADEWDKDDTNHWLNANCGCTLKVAVTKHDGMDDAVCDTCGWYDTTHTCAPTDGVWGYDEYEHWQYCPDHTSVWFNVDAHEGMQDGVCDVCSREEEYVFVLNYDKTGYKLSDIGPAYKGGDVVIPSTYRGLPVVEIEMYAFGNCKDNLTSVTIPANVKEIGFKAFAKQDNLETVIINGSTIIDAQAFYLCPKLKTVVIGEGTEFIYAGAFSMCFSLESVTLPNTVKEITGSVFANCDKLKTITIPASVEVIGECCFGGSGFTDIYFETAAPGENWDENWDEGLYKNEEIGRSEDVNLHWAENK